MKNLKTALISWYRSSKRDLPWRKNKDPYRIWLSEIILQQTKVTQGAPYFDLFVDNFPNVMSLAQASEDEVLKLWQGLGYYSRARNLHKAAKMVVRDWNGSFPSTAKSLKELPGIGEYTAAAVASIAFDERIPVVDGNVYRVLSRVQDIKEEIGTAKAYKLFAHYCLDWMDNASPGEFNQAIMEFGALQCTPRPNCDPCVLKTRCKSWKRQVVAERPVKKNKKAVKMRYFNYFVWYRNNKIKVIKRTNKDIWRHLYEFELHESDHLFNPLEINYSNNVVEIYDMQHKLTHQHLKIRFFLIQVDGDDPYDSTDYITIRQLTTLAVPKPVEEFMRQSNELRQYLF